MLPLFETVLMFTVVLRCIVIFLYVEIFADICVRLHTVVHKKGKLNHCNHADIFKGSVYSFVAFLQKVRLKS